jgi:hypothetical protein
LKGKDHLGELEIDGLMIFKWILNKCGMEWFYLAWDNFRWWAVVNA